MTDDGEHDVARAGVGDAVELLEVTGDWGPGTACVVLRPLRSHVLVAVLDAEGRHLETLPVGYESIGRTGGQRSTAVTRRRLLMT
jgi:hypothetical protein